MKRFPVQQRDAEDPIEEIAANRSQAFALTQSLRHIGRRG
jgi:hypothetical protein